MGLADVIGKEKMTTDELIRILEMKFEPHEVLEGLMSLAAIDESDFYEWVEPYLKDNESDLLELLIDG
jgi:hypothetical protein